MHQVKGSEDTAKVTPSQLLSSVRRDMEQAMRNRRMRLERERKGGLFEQRWQEVCDARAHHLRCAALEDPAEPTRGKVAPRRRLYVDGSMRQGATHAGGRIVDAKGEEAGWAVVTCDLHPDARCGNYYAANETVTAATAGQVSMELGTADYRGATTKSNNTAELTALLKAVEEELGRARDPVEICADSKYALGHASGAWLAPKRNRELVRRLRERVRELIRQRGHANVTLSHVRAHARTPGNEAADQLAKEAARDESVSKDARRALELASKVHRRVHGESLQTSASSDVWIGIGAPGRGFGDG